MRGAKKKKNKKKGRCQREKTFCLAFFFSFVLTCLPYNLQISSTSPSAREIKKRKCFVDFVSLFSKRFRLVSEQRKTKKGDFRF